MYNSLWFNSLISPPLSPPDWLFAPVWIILYGMMFASLMFYISERKLNKELGYFYFALQIILNISWAPLFFGAKNILAAFIVIIFLDIFVFLTIKKFYSISKLAGKLLIPYFIWILFATYLNLGYLILN